MLRAAPVHGIREVREVWSVEEEEEEEERLQRTCTVAALVGRPEPGIRLLKRGQ
jgi:hypothetical protein